jgi:uncharacterized membrane protein YgdD (TMEM256/DUF423 family)
MRFWRFFNSMILRFYNLSFQFIKIKEFQNLRISRIQEFQNQRIINMQKTFILAGSILGAFGVAIGAFGAHALKNMLTATNRIDTFETAVKYQFYHALALILVGIIFQSIPSKTLNYSGYSMILGTLIFSGSLYIICFTGIKAFGAIAPIGGTLMIIGWALLFWSVLKS